MPDYIIVIFFYLCTLKNIDFHDRIMDDVMDDYPWMES